MSCQSNNMLTACQGRFAQRCPSGPCEAPGTERTVRLLESHVHCSGLAASRRQWEPRARGGLRALLGCWLHMSQAMALTVLPIRAHSLLFPSLLQICLGHAMFRCHPTGLSREVQGGHQGTREVGWEPAWFLFSQLQKPRATLLRSMRSCWYEPQATKSLSLGFAI